MYVYNILAFHPLGVAICRKLVKEIYHASAIPSKYSFSFVALLEL
jgi:hypothetical protein